MSDQDDFPADECDDELDELEEAEADCGLDPEGYCSQAGTEHCDFCCPFRSSQDFRGSAAWYRKRGETPPWEQQP